MGGGRGGEREGRGGGGEGKGGMREGRGGERRGGRGGAYEHVQGCWYQFSTDWSSTYSVYVLPDGSEQRNHIYKRARCTVRAIGTWI